MAACLFDRRQPSGSVAGGLGAPVQSQTTPGAEWLADLPVQDKPRGKHRTVAGLAFGRARYANLPAI